MPDSPFSLVLASASPRRKELLKQMGIPFKTIPSQVDERTVPADHPRTFAIRAAFAKAQDVAASSPPDTWVLAADTVVTRDLVLYGKPQSESDARRILRTLSGQYHDVLTGLALVRAGTSASYLHAERTRVQFRCLSEEEIAAYIATGEPADKAGAYGIQGQGGALVESIEGDYYNVVGLPCAALAALMREAGIVDLPITVPKTPERWVN